MFCWRMDVTIKLRHYCLAAPGSVYVSKHLFLSFQARKSWIEETFCKRECVKFIPSSRDLHR